MSELKDKITINTDAELPKTAQIRQQIAWLIASGELVAGVRLPPIRTLADQLGVHMHTVRFAYQRLAADGFVDTRQGRGTVVLKQDPSQFAIQSARLPSRTIGVLIPDLNPFYIPFIRGVEDASRHLPALLFYSNTYDNPLLAEKTLHQMLVKGVDGLILASTGLDWDANWVKISKKLPPIVFVDEPNIRENVILFDSEGAGYKATRHLIEHSHKQIALITTPLDWPQAHTCYQGYQRALIEAGFGISDALIKQVPGYLKEDGYQAMEQLLAQDILPTAVFAISDILAIGALQALRDVNLQVPDDMALIGYNDIDLAELIDPPLSTLRVPTYQAGLMAVEMIQVLQSEEHSTGTRELLATELVIRHSCGCK